MKELNEGRPSHATSFYISLVCLHFAVKGLLDEIGSQMASSLAEINSRSEEEDDDEELEQQLPSPEPEGTTLQSST